jgi:hypothetical protein
MKIQNFTTSFVILAMLGSSVPDLVVAQDEKTTWDDLNLVKSSKTQRVYLLPGANFQIYNKVMLDTTEVAFQKNWMRNYNQSAGTVSRRVDQDDIDRVSNDISTTFNGILAEEFQKNGYQVVTSPGPDVLRIRTGIIDLTVSSPDVRSSSRTYSASWEAGQATLVVEARDSQSSALLGRALDRRLAGDRATQSYLRNSVTNKADFKILFRQWADLSVEGLTRLKNGSSGGVAQK